MFNKKFSHVPVEVPPVKSAYRQIKTSIPVPESIQHLEYGYNLESRSMHGQFPIIWDRAEGFQVHDRWGNTWIDFSSTIFVANVGHGNLSIRSAINAVLEKPLLHTYTYFSHERIDYLRYLIEHTPTQFEKAFLVSSGTEATEVALKLMRLYGESIGKRRRGIICFEGNWHGRTVGAQLMSSNEEQKKWIGFTDPDIHHLSFPYPWGNEFIDEPDKEFRKNIDELVKEKNIDPKIDLCGIMLETFQGWGAIFYPKKFIQEVEKFARENELLLAFDEIQSGFGRTGELFGYMHYDVSPDLICCGKGISSSLPLATVLGPAWVMDLPETGSMSSTHSGNPLACAAGLANFRVIIEENLVERSRDLGRLLHLRLNRIKEQYPNHIGWSQGKGLLGALIAIPIGTERATSLCNKISELCYQRGLLVVNTGREAIKIGPPLIIPEDALIEGIDVLESAIHDVINSEIK